MSGSEAGGVGRGEGGAHGTGVCRVYAEWEGEI